MTEGEHLAICGASTRAAAFSALRAGLKPWCIDLFADEDLKAKCPVMRIPRSEYPHRLPEWIARCAPPGPWMYTGGLENHPRLIRRIAAAKPLWGIAPEALLRVRNSPLSQLGLRSPETQSSPEGIPEDGSWLVKRRASCGGAGIYPWKGRFQHTTSRPRDIFYQKVVDGLQCSAIYLGTGTRADFLGLTRQLVGQEWLHAKPYAYCGSIGPITISSIAEKYFRSSPLSGGLGMRGLFGVDCVIQDDATWVIEINPRYTASMEVLELALGVPFLANYEAIFGTESGIAKSPNHEASAPTNELARAPHGSVAGKAIHFAKESLMFPSAGPWSSVLRQPSDVRRLPGFADIPASGTPIAAGQPVLTFFAGAAAEEACLEELKRIAAELDCWLYKGK